MTTPSNNSTGARPPRGDRGAVPPPDDIEVEDGSAPQPDPDSLGEVFRHPGVRNYLFAGLAGLAMVFVVMFQRGSDIGGVLLVILGAAGMVLRWPAAPLLFVLILSYFLVFPYGFPDPDTNPFEIEEGHFRPTDVILVASVVVYLASHYRVYGLTSQALPFESRTPRKGERPTRRPALLIAPGELPGLLYLTGGVVVAGQLVWLFVTNVEIDVLADFPLKIAETRSYLTGPPEMEPALTRLILTAGLIFFGTLLARLVYGYWRLRVMTAREAGMILQDAGWDETRRERTRVELWRAWGRKRAAGKGTDDTAGRPDGGTT